MVAPVSSNAVARCSLIRTLKANARGSWQRKVIFNVSDLRHRYDRARLDEVQATDLSFCHSLRHKNGALEPSRTGAPRCSAGLNREGCSHVQRSQVPDHSLADTSAGTISGASRVAELCRLAGFN
jgi:hypothetical protein